MKETEMTSQTGSSPHAADFKPPFDLSGHWDGEGIRAAFQNARHQPWTLGYRSFDAESVQAGPVALQGALPAGLRGTFFRTGPALHDMAGQRYAHRWDGDGLLQAFRLRDEGVTHQARYLRTEKYLREKAAGKRLVSGFGTHVEGSRNLPEPMEEMNAGNINIVPCAGEMLALWEPGSAYRVDPNTLETLGIKTWRDDLKAAAFSAHPRRMPDGTMWNFGCVAAEGLVRVFHVSASGALIDVRSLSIPHSATLHDFAVTSRHLVFLAPPLALSPDRIRGGLPFGAACEWRPSLGLRVVVVDLRDWSEQRFELPASNVFHIGNAWEDDDGVIRLDCMRDDQPRAMLAGWTLMKGEYRHYGGTRMTLITIDTRKGSVDYQTRHDLEGEYPAVAAEEIGQRYRQVVFARRSPQRDPTVPGFDQVASFDVEEGGVDFYEYGADWLVEEHVIASDCNVPGQRWVIGSALDLLEQQTVLSVFDAGALRAGPVMQARLPYALPVGLHGSFVAAD
ncbi:carotenoid oxygenase family protein [Aquabacterium sp. A7-Y]|uniref:carotenoid oxygenase family protein n=1 Tax=Aquabacterium sp. A7-Y TaxID=1349605 RepID=UPI00223E6663|nr:carotenoid oxygenase family protein [Aquabacterium sp. A7-Y]MCW7536259.1 carotenoid oxygenase family protein [Aquabacterium sp. A7-Y]